VFLRLIQPIPFAFASLVACFMAREALYIPGAKCPSQCAKALLSLKTSGSASGFTNPFFTKSINIGKRFKPCEYTPSKLFWAKIVEHKDAFAAEKEHFKRTLSNSFCKLLYSTVIFFQRWLFRIVQKGSMLVRNKKFRHKKSLSYK